MSAECRCGLDITYPEGTWPIGACPVCDRDKLDKIRALVALDNDELCSSPASPGSAVSVSEGETP